MSGRDVKESLSSLARLQELDLQLRKLHAEADEKPGLIAHERRLLDEARAALAAAETRARDAHKAADRKELDLRSKEAEIGRLEGQLNSATSNKVYSDLLLSIRGHEAEKGKIEETILAVMDEAEELDAAVDRVRAEARRAEDEFRAAEQVVKAQEAELRERIRQKELVRTALAQEVSAEVLDVYDRIRAIRAGVGLTRVETDGSGEEHFCAACQMQVTLQDVSLALRAEKPVQCKSCQRILHVETIPTREA